MADYLFEEELDDLTKDYASEEEFKIKEEDVDNVDDEVARWTREELMRSFMRNFAITQRFTFRQKKNEKLCVEIQKSNPGSIATCSREDGNLKSADMCISFKAALNGFSKGCRSILGLDGCFLKGKYGGQCLSIISLDANNGLFFIAVFICRSKCQAAWMKFLTLVQGQLTLHPSKLTFISDRQKGLVETYKKAVMKENLDKLGVAEPEEKTWLERDPYESWDKPLKKMVERLNLMQMTLMYERKLKDSLSLQLSIMVTSGRPAAGTQFEVSMEPGQLTELRANLYARVEKRAELELQLTKDRELKEQDIDTE
ncbi:hypothetical protein GIB67_011638 [Kingdonia uniflora]|uniref:MULE transposase domain-containing protein n=1 Tax=Kingdonia uniflora TaxID=39325 RepID=A0A7J7NMD1_9MAGN|nr:hypothetical protein GIB67_011638 [Kingdonia uniflora]